MKSTLLFCQATFVHIKPGQKKPIVLSSGQPSVTDDGYTGDAWKHMAEVEESGELS